MNSMRVSHFCWLLVTLPSILVVPAPLHAEKERPPQTAGVTVQTGGREGCTVEIDSAEVGKTDKSGSLELTDVEPGDHYVHVRCPGEESGRAHFISVSAGNSVEVRHEEKAPVAEPADPLAAVQARIDLQKHLQDAVRLRARGNVEEAVKNLHEALSLDPENADLHRELGITFLLAKEWKRARVEMLEAVRHMPDDADAYNGLGYALEKLGDLQAALEAYHTATRLEPSDLIYRQHYFGALAKLSAQQAEKKK